METTSQKLIKELQLYDNYKNLSEYIVYVRKLEKNMVLTAWINIYGININSVSEIVVRDQLKKLFYYMPEVQPMFDNLPLRKKDLKLLINSNREAQQIWNKYYI